MKNLLMLFLLTFSAFANAQTGTISGTVTDDNGEVVLFATVILKKDGSLVVGGQTDFDGKYHFKNIESGTYDMQVSYVGYETKKISSVVVSANKNLIVNVEITQGVEIIGCFVHYTYYPDLIDLYFENQGVIFNANEIERNPTKN